MGGQILGDRYEVEKQLGKQAGRWTLLGRDINTQQQVVLKLIFVDDDLHPDDLKLFGREVATLQTLSHPCIPKYLGYFEEELTSSKAVVLVQTYVPGRSLQDYIHAGRTFTEPEAKQMALVLLRILDYLHKQTPPILHRDLKPSNVVLADRRPHLVDFGSVKAVVSQENSAFTMVGTYGYMPPEQFSGRTVLASDLYSLGATIIAMLTGKVPGEIPRHNGHFILSNLVDLSPEFTDWLHWMTETSLDKRLQSAEEALRVLESGQMRGRL